MRIVVIEGSTQLFAQVPRAVLDVAPNNVWGEAAAPLQQLQADLTHGHDVAVLSRHGQAHEYAPHQINYRANVQMLADWQADLIIGTYTVGGIDPELGVGQLILPDQLIDYTWGRPSTFDDELRHIEFSLPFSESWRQRLLAAGPASGLSLTDGGVYGATQGPRLETIAEVRRLAQDGCTVVGMTGMPEAALCRELALPFVNLSLVVNPAAGVGDAAAGADEIDMDALMQASKAGAVAIEGLLAAFFQQV